MGFDAAPCLMWPSSISACLLKPPARSFYRFQAGIRAGESKSSALYFNHLYFLYLMLQIRNSVINLRHPLLRYHPSMLSYFGFWHLRCDKKKCQVECSSTWQASQFPFEITHHLCICSNKKCMQLNWTVTLLSNLQISFCWVESSSANCQGHPDSDFWTMSLKHLGNTSW